MNPPTKPAPRAQPQQQGGSANSAAADVADPEMSLLESLVPLLLTLAVGTGVALITLPGWLNPLAASLSGDAPKAAWYLSRASGITAFVLLWISMILGLLLSGKVAARWPGGVMANDLHQHASMVGLGTAIVHGAVLLGDRYANYTPAQLLIPFGSPLARLPVGLGQIGMYGLVLVVASFFIKQQIGRKTWRLIHFGSFAVFFLALIHGLASGTDTSAGSVQLLYWVSGGSVLFLTLFRVLMARWGMRPARGPAQRTPTA